MTTTEGATTITATVDEQLRRHFAEKFADDQAVREFSQQYRREGYVKIRNLVPDDLKESVTTEVHRLLEHARRIDLTMKETSGSPRRMSTVGQRHIAEHSTLIPEIYQSSAMMGFLSRIAREPVLPCPYEPEQFVLTKQEQAGDTHGWHWGDFSFTLIWIVEAPPIEAGGLLQCIPTRTGTRLAHPSTSISLRIRSGHTTTRPVTSTLSGRTRHSTRPCR